MPSGVLEEMVQRVLDHSSGTIKWTQRVDNINVNDMVVIIDSHCSPLMWRLGRLTEVTPGTDDIVRVATVLTSTGSITRPVVKLVPLLVNE